MKNHLKAFALTVAAGGVTLYLLHQLYTKKIQKMKKEFYERYKPCKSANQNNKQKIEILGKFTGNFFT